MKTNQTSAPIIPTIFSLFIFLLITIIALSIQTPNAYAIGISPSRTEVNFEPNLEETYTFQVLNNENKELHIEMYIKGDLADYITLSKTEATIPAEKPLESFSFKIKLPSKLERPGLHDTRIGAKDTTQIKISGTSVAAVAAVESQFWVYVPYPGKYLEAKLNIPDIGLGETATITLEIINRGTEPATATGEIKIYSSKDAAATNPNPIATFPIKKVKISPGETIKQEINWDTKNKIKTGEVSSGTHTAIATIKYNGETLETKKSFMIGEDLIKITNIFVEPIKKGSIAKFEVELESFSVETIKDVWAEAQIFSAAGTKIATQKSESIDMGPNTKNTVNIFWDTQDAEAGEYEANIIIHYLDKTTEEKIKITITKSKLFSTSLLLILITIAIIIILIAGFIIYKSRKGKTPQKKKRRKKRKRS